MHETMHDWRQNVSRCWTFKQLLLTALFGGLSMLELVFYWWWTTFWGYSPSFAQAFAELALVYYVSYQLTPKWMLWTVWWLCGTHVNARLGLIETRAKVIERENIEWRACCDWWEKLEERHEFLRSGHWCRAWSDCLRSMRVESMVEASKRSHRRRASIP